MTAKRTLGGGPSALGAVASLCVPDRIPLVGTAVGVAVWALRLAGDAAVGGLEDPALAPADADAADAPGRGGVIENKHSTDVESPPPSPHSPPPPRVYVSFHPEGNLGSSVCSQ